jgi:hypothetical protein
MAYWFVVMRMSAHGNVVGTKPSLPGSFRRGRGHRMSRLSVKHFPSIEALLAALRAEVPENLFRTDPADSGYEWVTDGERVKLVPSMASTFWSPFLYRGQTRRHQPCVPGVFRGLPLVDHPLKLSQLGRGRCLLARVRLEEFLCALARHPASAFAHEIGLVTYPEAIAQHYEMQTDRIDLTQDPEIAAFFATNERLADGQWRPKATGEPGVIYRLDFPYFHRGLRSNWSSRQGPL